MRLLKLGSEKWNVYYEIWDMRYDMTWLDSHFTKDISTPTIPTIFPEWEGGARWGELEKVCRDRLTTTRVISVLHNLLRPRLILILVSPRIFTRSLTATLSSATAAEFLEWVFTFRICDRILDKELYDLYHPDDVPRYEGQ